MYRRSMFRCPPPLLWIFLGVLLGWTPAASADVVLGGETRDLRRDPPTVQTTRLLLSGDRLKAELPDPPNPRLDREVIFRGDLGVVWTIRPDKRQYTVLDRAAAAAARAALDERLAALPREDREAVEELLTEQRAERDKRQLRAIPQKETLGGRPVTKYDVLWEGEKVAELWATPWSAAGLDREDLAALTALEGFRRETLGEMAGGTDPLRRSPLEFLGEVEGLPVKVRWLESGKAVREAELLTLETRPLPESTFALPEGYTEIDKLAGRRPAPAAEETAAEAGEEKQQPR